MLCACLCISVTAMCPVCHAIPLRSGNAYSRCPVSHTSSLGGDKKPNKYIGGVVKHLEYVKSNHLGFDKPTLASTHLQLSKIVHGFFSVVRHLSSVARITRRKTEHKTRNFYSYVIMSSRAENMRAHILQNNGVEGANERLLIIQVHKTIQESGMKVVDTKNKHTKDSPPSRP
ncbi:hypothetical protein F4801DRAFT_546231 [Xylaria longipes]|nr:hypothetical protein F4801DRAFT_546231 [Xylaria longipes]